MYQKERKREDLKTLSGTTKNNMKISATHEYLGEEKLENVTRTVITHHDGTETIINYRKLDALTDNNINMEPEITPEVVETPVEVTPEVVPAVEAEAEVVAEAPAEVVTE